MFTGDWMRVFAHWGATGGTKSVVKRSSATHYTPGDSIMTAWWGKDCFVVQYASVCCHYEWKIQKQWEVKGDKVGQLEMRRTSSGALFRCSLRNISSACCDASGWEVSSHLYSLSLMSVQQLQPSHDSTQTVPRLAWWCICRCRLELYQCVSILAGTYIALLRLHCVTHCCSALKDCGKEWRHVVPLLACLCGLALMCMHWMGSTGACGTCWHVWSHWMLCMHVTSPLLQQWLDGWALSYWSEWSVLCVWTSVKAQIFAGVFFFFVWEQTVCRASVCLLLPSPLSPSPCCDWCFVN